MDDAGVHRSGSASCGERSRARPRPSTNRAGFRVARGTSAKRAHASSRRSSALDGRRRSAAVRATSTATSRASSAMLDPVVVRQRVAVRRHHGACAGEVGFGHVDARVEVRGRAGGRGRGRHGVGGHRQDDGGDLAADERPEGLGHGHGLDAEAARREEARGSSTWRTTSRRAAHLGDEGAGALLELAAVLRAARRASANVEPRTRCAARGVRRRDRRRRCGARARGRRRSCRRPAGRRARRCGGGGGGAPASSALEHGLASDERAEGLGAEAGGQVRRRTRRGRASCSWRGGSRSRACGQRRPRP